ncbi:uncharacterized protein PHACADRAFT_184113 [Phanerochaete carnosa HHB-10118-sp]|uniref:Uncharacterized protein n=1 Tax=Phanerochaete carnosa (strain HHB-10118-sp) TaxID=650164 RepID=K5WXW4_PHACS|nr:uncharacterized protein PHACADRAFT_184113 [Phanerochaete carnosa HHB-10118-sp]EKM55302.1 hypothetical protein PHACADRAFT_184113 [Phanerochaete carnosa HHB-10118-sp]
MSAVLSEAKTALGDLLSANEHILDDFDLSLLLHDALDWLQACRARLFDTPHFDIQRRVLALDVPSFLKDLPWLEFQRCYSTFAVSALLLLLLLLFRRRRPAPEYPDSPRIHAPLDALLSFLTPTSSSWPRLYLSVAQDGISSPPATLAIPLSCLLDDVVSGAVELRSAAIDLPPFISGTLSRHGWTVAPRVEVSLRVHVALRIACLRLASWKPSTHCHTVDAGTPSVNPSSLSYDGYVTSASLAAKRDLAADLTMLSLDAVPLSKLETYVRTLQLSLPLGASAMVGFSTRSSSVPYMSTAFVHASIPFFARKHVMERRTKPASQSDKSIAGRCPSLDMEPTPLLTSLDHHLKLLTSGATPLSVESVQNVSVEYASYLDRYVQELTEIPAVRARFVAQWGLAGWREERLLVAWEAATFRAGLMSRWAVYITRRA